MSPAWQHLVNTNCLLILYYSLIYPYVSHCNTIWVSTFPKKLHKTLVRQKHFVRIATQSVLCSPSAPLTKKLTVLSIYDINIFQIHVFIYKILLSGRDITVLFQSYFKANSQVHSYTTRNFTCRGQFSIRYRGLHIMEQLFSYVKTVFYYQSF